MLDIEFEIRITFEIVEEEVDKNDSVGCDEDVEVSEDSAEGRVDEGVDVADEVDEDVDDADVDDVPDEVDDDVDDEDVDDEDVDDADLRFV